MNINVLVYQVSWRREEESRLINVDDARILKLVVYDMKTNFAIRKLGAVHDNGVRFNDPA